MTEALRRTPVARETLARLVLKELGDDHVKSVVVTPEGDGDWSVAPYGDTEEVAAALPRVQSIAARLRREYALRS